jgi:SAM-dependent methyltransferase
VAEAVHVEACRSCGAPSPRPFLSLGVTPIANALLREADLAHAEPRFPLGVAFCETCTLVQLTDVLPAEVIFGHDYPYYSSFSDALLAHARDHVEGLLASGRLGPGKRLVEVASNDGYLLAPAMAHGVDVLGIEPTPGPAAAARALGIPTRQEFFDVEVARAVRAEAGPADVIVANNVMAHVPDLNGFVAGFRELIADDGLITIENPWIRDLIRHAEFDTIYHEHYCYFSCTAVDALMRRHGLFLNDVEYFPDLHGGTLRWHVGPRAEPTERALAYLREEAADGLTSFGAYSAFAERVDGIVTDLQALLAGLRSDGASIAAYGAAAKGATLLNRAGIDATTLDYVVDRNTYKQGNWMPGARLPIVGPDVLADDPPDYLLILAWNFADEIMRQQAAYAAAGGNFIIPIPAPRIV